MESRVVVCIVVVATVVCCVGGQKNVCIDQKTCGACNAAGPLCGWCTQDGYDAKNKERCDTMQNLIKHGCDSSYIVSHEHDIEYNKDEPPQNARQDEDAIQLSPQEITVQLRPNTPFKFKVNFRQADNYPVDLYYVMDLSNSMKDDKAKLAELGDLLAEDMSKITENFRLGFGSFVDKKTMPYVSTVPDKLEAPCDGCAAPYGFHNQLSLTEDTPQFRTKVFAAPISGNLDHPEGGFDAIMQAVACQNEIGWREKSRKMLLYSTDASFHYAGDGMLGGIVKPCDGQCHMENNYYTESLNQDYPSVSQVSSKIAERKVNIIFAVTKEKLDVYRKLSQHIEGSAVGELADDSSNIVELVRENYNKISGTVELKTEGAEGVHVSFKTKCFGQDERDTGVCDGIKVGQNVSYEVTVEIRECPANEEDWEKTFSIYPVGLTEQLKVHLKYLCDCDCEAPELGGGTKEENSPRCNGSGTFECGACTCNPGMYGKNCECDGTNLDSEDYNAACRMTNRSEVCEGNGQCLCGQCDCNPITAGDQSKKYSGRYCECDDYSCDYYDNKLCGGPGRGKCHCGSCVCNPGFTGSACDCAISQEPCRAKESGLICNGKGTCVCGVCTCNTESYYRGPTCEDCPSCPGKCEQNRACVLCRAFESAEHSKEYCDANCTHVSVVDHVEEMPGWKLCKFRDESDGCYYYFIYAYDGDFVKAQRTKECPTPVNVLAIVLGIILAIILIGLLLLCIWKIIVTIHDRREYAKFMREEQKRKWEVGENPVYKPATSKYDNPMYAQ